MIRHPTEAGVSREHAEEVEDDEQRGSSHYAKAAPTLLDGKREIRWEPCEQPPPSKHSKKIKKEQSDGALQKWRTEDLEEGITVRRLPRQCCPLRIRRSTLSFLPHLRFGHAIPNPESDRGRQDPDKEHRAPVGIAQDYPRNQRRHRKADCPRALHQSDRLRPQFVGPSLGDQGRTRIPLAAHPQAENEAKHRQTHHASGEPGCKRTD